MTAAYEKMGTLPRETPMLVDNGMQLFTEAQNSAALANAAGGSQILVRDLQAHQNRLQAGDYFCILAYIEMNATHHVLLQTMRQAVRDAKQVATCLGYGPRFLHSRVETFTSWLNVAGGRCAYTWERMSKLAVLQAAVLQALT